MQTAVKYTWIVGLTTQSGGILGSDFVIKATAPTLKQAGINGFSVVNQIGYWNGVEEKSLAVSYIDLDGCITDVISNAIATQLGILFNQEAILLTQEPILCKFV